MCLYNLRFFYRNIAATIFATLLLSLYPASLRIWITQKKAVFTQLRARSFVGSVGKGVIKMRCVPDSSFVPKSFKTINIG